MACSVLTRFSADPWTDVVAQAAAVEANVVLVERAFADQQSVGAAPADPTFTLVVARLSATQITAGDPVGVLTDGGGDGRAALILGSAAAGSLRGPLLVSAGDSARAGRKVAAALAPLGGLGVDVRLAQTPTAVASASLVVVGRSTPAPAVDDALVAVLVVQAGLDDANAELTERVAKLVATE